MCVHSRWVPPVLFPASRCVTGAGVRGNFLSANLQPGCVFMQRPSAAAKSAAGAQEERVHVAAAAAGRWEVEVGGWGGSGKRAPACRAAARPTGRSTAAPASTIYILFTLLFLAADLDGED